MPSAMSSPSEPVDVDSISATGLSPPSRMIEPLPNCRSIWASAESSAFCRSLLRLSVMSRRFAVAMGRVPYSMFTGGRQSPALFMPCSRHL
jgi:hypothetical protein